MSPKGSKQAHSTRCNRTKTKIIALDPNKKLANAKKIREDPRDTKKLIRMKAKQKMTNTKRWSQRGSSGLECLNPGNTTLG